MGLEYNKGTAEAGENKSTVSTENVATEGEIIPTEQKTEEAAGTSATGNSQEESKKKKVETTDEENLSKFFDSNPDKKVLQIKDSLKVKEGDYEEGVDGTVIIRAKHLADDMQSMINNPQKFFNLRKSNPEKAVLFTKWMGIVRPDGKPDVDLMGSILNRFLIAKDPEEERAIIEEHFPNLVEGKLPFKFEEPQGGKQEDRKVFVDVPYRYDELSSAIDLFLESYKTAKTNEQPDLTSQEIWDNASFFKALKGNKFDPETGKLRTPSDIVKIAIEKSFNTKSTGKNISSQGGTNAKQKVENAASTTTRKTGGPKGWYKQ